jgi:hypothetical protein
MSDPFLYLNSINYTKGDLMTGTENDELAEQDYKPFLINRGLSMFPDTIMYANDMNIKSYLDSKLQYHYLLNSVRPKKRFGKWVKKVASDDVEAVQQYFQYNDEQALIATSLLSSEQLQQIKEKLSKGGVNDS